MIFLKDLKKSGGTFFVASLTVIYNVLSLFGLVAASFIVVAKTDTLET